MNSMYKKMIKCLVYWSFSYFSFPLFETLFGDKAEETDGATFWNQGFLWCPQQSPGLLAKYTFYDQN